jgi:hypothetical protein
MKLRRGSDGEAGRFGAPFFVADALAPRPLRVAHFCSQ